MKTFDIVVQKHTVQNDITVRSRLTKCDVGVPKVLERAARNYISVPSGIAFLAWSFPAMAVKAASSDDIGGTVIMAEVTQSAEKYVRTPHIPLVIDASAALSSSFGTGVQESCIAIGCLCDAVMRRLRKLSEVDAMGTLGSIDEMTLSELDYLEQ